VIIPLRHIARPETAPSRCPSSTALAVPIPCDDAPMARPKAILSLIPIRLIKNGPNAAPKIPTKTTTVAVSGGIPPILADISIAMGVVTDFGAREDIISGEA